jgi:hypothetical protein
MCDIMFCAHAVLLLLYLRAGHVTFAHITPGLCPAAYLLLRQLSNVTSDYQRDVNEIFFLGFYAK